MAVFVPRFLRQLRDVLITSPADTEVLTYDSADGKWKNAAGGGGGGAPTTADYLVGTTQAGLSAEIVVGATPGGELGGTWAAPTVDATHSGSSHAAVQAAAEATAAAALDAHLADATDAHDATAISFAPDGSIAATTVQAAIVEVRDEAAGGGAPSTADYLVGTAQGGLSAEIVVGATPGGELGGTWAAPTVDATHSGSSHASVQAAAEATAQAALDAHTGDATDAHDASAISVVSTTLSGTGTDVQAVFEEIDNLLDDHSARHENGGADEVSVAGLSGLLADGQTPLAHASSHQDGGSDELSIAGLSGTSAALQAHLDDAADAHDASAISFVPTGTVAATDVQAAIAEVASESGASSTSGTARALMLMGG